MYSQQQKQEWETFRTERSRYKTFLPGNFPSQDYLREKLGASDPLPKEHCAVFSWLLALHSFQSWNISWLNASDGMAYVVWDTHDVSCYELKGDRLWCLQHGRGQPVEVAMPQPGTITPPKKRPCQRCGKLKKAHKLILGLCGLCRGTMTHGEAIAYIY